MGVEKPLIRPREEWAQGLAPTGSLAPEEDVRFLLVHHTATPNSSPDSSVAQLRSFYRYHTGSKDWPDIAYNFLIDSGGQIWEGRAGSLAGPIRGDATGGNQGFSQLCCFIGDFTSVPPSPAAIESMTRLLAWLADRHAVSLAPGASVTFTSRGSNRWPKGETVTTDPIAGHRDMSLTTCPGDAAYALIGATLLPVARSLTLAAAPSPTLAPPSTSASSAPSATPQAPSSAVASPASGERAGGGSTGMRESLLAAGTAVAIGGLAFILRRRMTLMGRRGRHEAGRGGRRSSS